MIDEYPIKVLAVSSTDLLLEIAASKALATVSPTVTDSQFVFIACFDGTNNDKTNLAPSEKMTNIGAISELAKTLAQDEPNNYATRYYAGPGTAGTLLGSSAIPSQVTAQIVATAEGAYNDFKETARLWLQGHPDADPVTSITTALTGFSRGCVTAVAFSQLLNTRGLVINGVTLIPGSAESGTGVAVSAMLLLDPVTTGYLGSLAIPVNVNLNNCVDVRARN